MIPLVWKQCAPRLVMALAAMTILLAAVGCGSSGNGIITPLPGNKYSNASLTGQYVIAQTGIGVNQAGTSAVPFSETIIFSSDGNGHLNLLVDDFNQGGQLLNPTLPVTGTYGISTDGTGTLIFNFSGTLSNFKITMIDDSHFYVVEWDGFATASGLGEKQDMTVLNALPTGNFVFKAHNLDSSSRVGGVTITNGAISGTEDLLSLGTLSSSRLIATTVGMTTPDSNGRGTFTLNDGSSFIYYTVNATRLHLMSNTGSLEIGLAEKQTGPFSLTTLGSGNSYVFGSSGDTQTSGAAGIHSAGVFTTDGNGHITGGTVDYVQDLTVNANLTVASGSYTLDASGHGEIDLTVSVGTIRQIFWMVDATRAYFLADGTTAVEDGTFSQQQGAPFSALGNQAAFVMDGFDVAYKDRVGAFAPTSSGFNWNQVANSFDSNPNDITFGGNPSPALATSGTAQVSSNGRVAVAVNGVTSNLVFYLSGPGTGFMVQEDANIGGAFSQQATQ